MCWILITLINMNFSYILSWTIEKYSEFLELLVIVFDFYVMEKNVPLNMCQIS